MADHPSPDFVNQKSPEALNSSLTVNRQQQTHITVGRL
jgi:hypothetical protein